MRRCPCGCGRWLSSDERACRPTLETGTAARLRVRALLFLIWLMSGCAAVDALDGSKPDSPSGCCWRVQRDAVEACLLLFIDKLGACVFTCCVPDGFVQVCEPDENGNEATEPPRSCPL